MRSAHSTSPGTASAGDGGGKGGGIHGSATRGGAGGGGMGTAGTFASGQAPVSDGGNNLGSCWILEGVCSVVRRQPAGPVRPGVAPDRWKVSEAAVMAAHVDVEAKELGTVVLRS